MSRLLILSLNYAPEPTGFAPHTTALAEHLVDGDPDAGRADAIRRRDDSHLRPGAANRHHHWHVLVDFRGQHAAGELEPGRFQVAVAFPQTGPAASARRVESL